MSEERYEDDYKGVPTEAQLVRRINGYFCDWNMIDQSGRLRITRQAVQFYRVNQARDLGYPGPAMSFHLESKLDSIDSLANRYPFLWVGQSER